VPKSSRDALSESRPGSALGSRSSGGVAGAADDHPVLHADDAGDGVGCLAERLLSFVAVGYRVSRVAVLPVAAMTLGTGTELLDGWRDMRRHAMRSLEGINCLASSRLLRGGLTSVALFGIGWVLYGIASVRATSGRLLAFGSLVLLWMPTSREFSRAGGLQSRYG
jgi:hypothetical protein